MKAKPGDLAIIIKGRERNIGKLVVVVSYIGEVDYSHIGYGPLPCWNVESLGGNDLDVGTSRGSRGYIPDMALAPIPNVGAKATAELLKSKAKWDFDKAMEELGEVFRSSSWKQKSGEDSKESHFVGSRAKEKSPI